jgi:arylsulfatase A-like enzyme
VSAEQPNIVGFFWDNLGWGEVGCYGGDAGPDAPAGQEMTSGSQRPPW